MVLNAMVAHVNRTRCEISAGSGFQAVTSRLAASQFELAKALDPRDPTPWYYDAILKQTQNRPVDALDDLRESIARNDDRAVYRSRLLLDQDAAARDASLARAFDDVGFQHLGVLSASDALGQDPTNPSAHRLLADIYAQTPRYDIARVSESLQSQLLQPLTLTPVQPSLVTRDLNILRASGPTQVGVNEFNSLFERSDGSHGRASVPTSTSVF